MNKNENRGVIKYLWLKGYKPIEIFEEMSKVLGVDIAHSWTTVKYWAAEFKGGRVSIEDVRRSGRPKEVTTLENITKIEKLVEQNRQIKVSDIAKAIGLSKERAFNILDKELKMRKLENGWERIKQLNENDEINAKINDDKKRGNKDEFSNSTIWKENAAGNKRKVAAENNNESAPSTKKKRS